MPIMSIMPLTALALSATILNNQPLTAQSTIQQPIQTPPPCVAIPDNAPQSEIDCLEAACKAFQIAWSACSTAQCRQLARLQYLGDVAACDPAMFTAPAKTSWITLSWDGTDWSYAFARQPDSGVLTEQGTQNFNF